MNGKIDLMPLGVAAIGIAAVFLGADILKKWAPGGAGNPTSGVYQNPALCVLFGKYCPDDATAGSTGTVPPEPTNPDWTSDPSAYWAKARRDGLSLMEACMAREPTPTGWKNCMAAGW